MHALTEKSYGALPARTVSPRREKSERIRPEICGSVRAHYTRETDTKPTTCTRVCKTHVEQCVVEFKRAAAACKIICVRVSGSQIMAVGGSILQLGIDPRCVFNVCTCVMKSGDIF